jgi:hypothetical protein
MFERYHLIYFIPKTSNQSPYHIISVNIQLQWNDEYIHLNEHATQALAFGEYT